MPASIVRVVRLVGWIALLGSCGVVVAVVVVEAAAGPEIGQRLWPTPRLWRYFFTTLWMSAATVVMALLLALPAAYALIRAPHGWQRRWLLALCVIPLLTMPSTFAYAWLIVATDRGAVLRSVLNTLGLNAVGVEPLRAAWVLAVWLWPIPALVLAAAFRYMGAGAYRLACMDASPRRAFVVGALPVMRGPLIAACAIVFILAAIDTTVAPLMNASDVWAVETLACAKIAGKYSRPAAYLFWQAWPMLAVTAGLVLAALPGLRQMAGWASESDVSAQSDRPSAGSGAWVVSVVLATGMIVAPILIFAFAMAGRRYTAAESFAAAFGTLRVAGVPTLIVALSAAAAAMAVAVALLDEPNWPRPLRVLSAIGVGVVLLIAVLPPPLIAETLVAFFSNEHISKASGWNVYDNTPITWIAAMVARFAFIPVCLVRLLNRRIPRDLTDQALSDGANRIERLSCARLPMMWRPLLAAGVAVAGLSLSEVAAAGLVQPTQWLGGSLAVYVDWQMHYGRHNQTIALSLIMMAMGIVAALLLPLLVSRRR